MEWVPSSLDILNTIQKHSILSPQKLSEIDIVSYCGLLEPSIMTDFGTDGYINVTVNRKSKKKPGFEVEQRSDGFYYITKTPKNCTKISVGDRVLEINGTSSEEFKSEENANDLVDSLRIDV